MALTFRLASARELECLEQVSELQRRSTMRLASRDALATLFVAISLGVYAAWALGMDPPGFGTVAAVAAAVLVLGLAASASAVIPGFAELLQGSRPYLAIASALGLLALAAGLYALVAGEAAALTVLISATLSMWAMATARHAALLQPHARSGHR
jgi:hypothetical protein